jgi:tetratricopeptide (TPR) repeat protein
MENYEAALADYTKAANLNSSNPIYWKQRGQAYHNLGQHSLAAADLTKAIVLDENYAAAYWRRGEAYMALGDRDAAIADLTRALPLVPESAKDIRVEIKALLEKAKQNAAAKAAPGKNRFCGNCGKELQPDQKFCPECGTRA